MKKKWGFSRYFLRYSGVPNKRAGTFSFFRFFCLPALLFAPGTIPCLRRLGMIIWVTFCHQTCRPVRCHPEHYDRRPHIPVPVVRKHLLVTQPLINRFSFCFRFSTLENCLCHLFKGH